MRKLAFIVLLVVVGALLAAGCGTGDGDSSASKDPAALRPGRVASDFTVALFDSGTFTLSEQRGKVVLVNFWASWCPPCREEAPVLERAWQKYKDKGFILVGVDIWDNDKDARSFLQEFRISYPNGPDNNGEIAIEYGLTGVPESWFLNKDGRLVRRWVGPLTDQQITAFIEEAMR